MWFPSLSSITVAGVLVALANGLPQESNEGGSSGGSSGACNNSPSLCSRAYNNVTYLGGHNAAFLRDESTGNSLAGNQYFNATRALDAGVRLLQSRVYMENGTLTLCHSSCSLLNAGPLEDWLAAIGRWIDGHPREVVTILLVNSADAAVDDYAAAFRGSGLAEHSYAPESFGATGDWPTLEQMIDRDERVVSFVTEITHAETAPFILDQFSHVFETHFEVTELSGFNCTLDRPTNQNDAATALENNFLSLVNHFKYQQLTVGIQLPDVDSIEVVNSPGTGAVGNLGRHLESCQAEWGLRPNFVLVDFFDEGDPMAAVDRLNDISDVEGRTDAEDQGGDTSGAGAGTQRRGGFAFAFLAFFAGVLVLA